MRNSLQRIFALAPSTSTSQESGMSSAECQALRQLLLLTQAEAGSWIGNVTERSWQYWESGKRPVPEDVAVKLRSVAKERFEHVDAALLELSTGARPVSVWYQSARDWQWRSAPDEKPWAWKLHNSIAAELCARQAITLVPFDPESFAAWSKGHKPVTADAEGKEHLRWAIEQLPGSGDFQ